MFAINRGCHTCKKQFEQSARPLHRACRPVVELLENRRLLSVSYNVPLVVPGTTTAVDDVNLRIDNFDASLIDVRFNSDALNVIRDQLAFDADNIISIHGNRDGLILHDFLSALEKNGGRISFDNSSNGVLEVHGAGGEDMEAVNHPSTGFPNGVAVRDTSNRIGRDVVGAGVSKMVMVGDSGGGVTLTQITPFAPDISLVIDTDGGANDAIDIASSGTEGAANTRIKSLGGSTSIALKGDHDDGVLVRIDFGTSSGNTLDIKGGVTCVLATSGSSMNAGTVTLSEDGNGVSPSLIVSSPISAGVITVGSDCALSVEAAAALTTLTVNGAAYYTGSSSGSTVTTLNGSGTVDFLYGSSVTVGTLSVSGTATQHVGGSVTVTGSGAPTVEASLPASDLDVPTGESDVFLTFDSTNGYRVRSGSATGSFVSGSGALTPNVSGALKIWGKQPG
jgi:hypothetical protein